MRLGQVREIIWGELNLKSVWDVLEGITIGRTGHVYIMDLSGRYIAHREIDRVVSAPPIKKPEIFKEVRASDIPVKWIEQRQGTRIFVWGHMFRALTGSLSWSSPCRRSMRICTGIFLGRS